MESRPPAMVWWLIWFAILGAFLVTCTIFVHAVTPVTTDGMLGLVAAAPLVTAAVVRFAILPAARDNQKRFVLFIVGLALSESTGLIAVILGGPARDYLAAAAIVLIVLHAPPLVLRKAI
jgi:hypothetical protein